MMFPAVIAEDQLKGAPTRTPIYYEEDPGRHQWPSGRIDKSRRSAA